MEYGGLMPGARLEEKTPEIASAARIPAPISGRKVLFSMLAIGLTVVLGVGTFAALTRPKGHGPTPAGSASATSEGAGHRGW